MSSVTIFREIEQAFDKINCAVSRNGKKVQLTSSDIETFANDSLKSVRISTLNKLVSYIDKGDWFKSKSKVEFLANYKLTNSEYSKRTGRKEASIRQTCVRNSNTIRGIIGKDMVERILYGSSDGLKQVNIELDVLLNDSNMLSNFVFEPIKDLVGLQASNEYSLSDLNREFIFLQLCSMEFFEGLLSVMDKDKLVYILNSLRGLSGDSFQRRCDLYNATQVKENKVLLINLIMRIKSNNVNASCSSILSFLNKKKIKQDSN